MCITRTFEMSFFWIYVTVFNFEQQIVLAGQKTFGPQDYDEWREIAHGTGTGEYWFINTNPEKRLFTQIEQSKSGGKELGESWFITQEFKKANLSYINITALPVECDGKKSCDLNIHGNKNAFRSVPIKPDRQFITDNFELIETISFTQNKRELANVAIRKAYKRLCISTTPTKNKTTWNIYSMKLSYNFCEEDGINKISIPVTNSSHKDTNVTGKCSPNSISMDNKTTITAKCSPKGEWRVDNNQKCLCMKGFGFDRSIGCLRCLKNYYKAEISDAKCEKCAEGKTNNKMNTNCQCLKDRYIGEDENGPCYVSSAVPSQVEGLETKIHDFFVRISWRKPLNDGGLNDSLTYSVECYYCNQSKCDKEVENAIFAPGKTNLTTTYVNVSNLKINQQYKLRIFSRNSLNVPSDKWKYTELKFTFKISEHVIEVPSTVPTSATPAYKTDPTAKVRTKVNVLTIILSVVASLSVLLNIFLLGILLNKRRHRSPKSSTAGSIPLHVQRVKFRQNDVALHNYEEPYCKEIDMESFKEVSMSARCGRSNVDETRRNVTNQHRQPLTRQLFHVIAPDGETKPNNARTKNDHGLQAELLVNNAGYLSPVDGKNVTSLNHQVSEPSAYAKLEKSLTQDERDTGHYQKLIKRDSDIIIPNDGDKHPGQDNQILEPSAYAKLDKGGLEKENHGDYQKLIKRNLPIGIPNDSERATYEDVRQAKTTPCDDKLDNSKRNLDHASYQALIKQ